MARARNTASVEDIARVMEKEVPVLRSKYFLVVDDEEVIEHYSKLMVAILQRSRRPTKDLLVKASMHAFEKGCESEARTFGQRLYQCFQHCTEKRRNMKTGKRLSRCVAEVVAAMETEEPEERSCSSSCSRGPTRKAKTAEEILSLYNMEPSARSAMEACVAIESSGDEQCVEVPDMFSVQEVEKKQPPQYLDRVNMCLVRITSTGSIEAKMSPGPGGFAIAQFPGEDEIFRTEVPNVLLPLHGGIKRPAAFRKPAMWKTPAAASTAVEEDEAEDKEEEEEEEATQEEDGEVEDGPVSAPSKKLAGAPSKKPACGFRQYHKMWYKKMNAWGIRRAFFDKKQVFAV